MSSIKILPEDLINKIAAGEVVERPASVVKELVENSIDAGATQIVVEIREAGKKLIRVADNGAGMSEEEIKLALQRHSTSKISSADDLFNIQTLGFRGEALPSIASVSKLKIEKNPSGQGLTVEAKELFHNTPARRKFLKSNMTEIGHIGEIVSKYTLAYPGIAFKLTVDEKTLLTSTGSGQQKEAIMSVYGAELTKELAAVSWQSPAAKISGYVSRPVISRIDKNYETFFVNGRFVKNFLLNRALEEAYRTLIPNNRYPAAILFVEVDPKQVDVNVHPAKREVKFLKTNEIMSAVTEAVRIALSGVVDHQNIRVSDGENQQIRQTEKQWRPEMAETFFSNADWQLPPTGLEVEFEVSGVQPLIPLYQLKSTYIIATDGEELVLIDQHAAHERIIYDNLSRQSSVTNHQTLLIPETIELSPAESATLTGNLELLTSLGFEVEEFGNNSFILRSVPAVSVKNPAKQLLLDIVSEMQSLGKASQIDVKRENLRKLVACHSAIKAGDKLTAQEMGQLIRELYATPNPQTCPHGRPTMVRLTEAELAKRFGRRE